MAGPILYSTNPWITHDIVTRYCGGRFFVWCSEYYDPAMAPPGSAQAAVAPSSSPKGIYDTLWEDWTREDSHSALISGYRRTFKRLAAGWVANGSITETQAKEIVATVTSRSWKIWRPQLFVIGRSSIVPDTRIAQVLHARRAGYGPELQIADLRVTEFDMIETRK